VPRQSGVVASLSIEKMRNKQRFSQCRRNGVEVVMVSWQVVQFIEIIQPGIYKPGPRRVWSPGVSFLSAVGDRFGFWGPFGHSHVAWGDFSHFTAYTAKLNWFMPAATIPVLAWASTCAETLLGVALVLGAFNRLAALLSGLLLLLFALVMTFALGLEAPLSFSVFLCLCRSVPAGNLRPIFLEP
jgi:uncharacterized membrane protein YphA (DoxX/SURF4 family)